MSRMSVLVSLSVAFALVGLVTVFHTDHAPMSQPRGLYIAMACFVVLTICGVVAAYLETNRLSEVEIIYWQDHVFMALFYLTAIVGTILVLAWFDGAPWILVPILFIIIAPSADSFGLLRKSYLTAVRRLYANQSHRQRD